MSTEMVLFGFKIVLVLKGIFAFTALLNVIVLRIWVYRSMSKMRKFHFWIACILAVFAVLWVTTMHVLLVDPDLTKLIPQTGWYVLILGSPTAALAAGLTVGLHTKYTNSQRV